MICDFFFNAGQLFKIYKDLCSFNYCIYKIHSYICYLDRENTDEQLHCDSFSVKRKYLYKEIVEIMKINFNRHVKVEKINSLRLHLIDVL